MANIDVFISHSSRDEPIARRLTTLIRSSLNLEAERIRCTSVDGFRLPVGISTDERLRQEIHSSKAFIAVITPKSIESTYVLFELGARWGAQKPLIPLLASGVGSSHLKGPLSAINALSCDDAAQLHQFVTDLAQALGEKPEQAAVFQRCINELIEESGKQAAVTTKISSGGKQRLAGQTGVSQEWGSAWLDLGTVTDFHRGDKLHLSVGGAAEKVLVRLLPQGASPDKPVGILPGDFSIPQTRVIEVELNSDHSGISQISVHGGPNPWGMYPLGTGNGPATLTDVELMRQ